MTERPRLPAGLPAPTWTDPDFGIALYLGDCREILPTLPPADVTISDPPYGISGGTNGKVHLGGAIQRPEGGIDIGSTPGVDFGDWDHDFDFGFIAELGTPSAALFHDQKRATEIVDAAEAAGLRLRQFFYWDKGDAGINPRRNFVSCVEQGVWIARNPYPWNGGGASPNIYRLPRQKREHHPTEKPLPLMLWLVEKLTTPGLTVLDPFMGSGSTGVAAVGRGRGFIGIEREPGFFEVALARITEAVINRQDGPLFAYHQPALIPELFD